MRSCLKVAAILYLSIEEICGRRHYRSRTLRAIKQSVAHLVQTQHFAIQAFPASVHSTLMPQDGNSRPARSDSDASGARLVVATFAQHSAYLRDLVRRASARERESSLIAPSSGNGRQAGR